MSKNLKPFELDAVEIKDEFWKPRKKINRSVTLNHVFNKMSEHGRFENFRGAARGNKSHQGRAASDSDVYKWLEAASYELSQNSDEKLMSRVSKVISLIQEAQREDGYLNTYFSLVEPGKEWTNLSQMHELYCAGHLVQAAVAHNKMTERDELLTIAQKFADHIYESIGPNGKIKKGVPGHEGVEMALVDLYRVTDEKHYLDLASCFIDRRGTQKSPFREEFNNPHKIAGSRKKKKAYKEMLGDSNGEYNGEYLQDHKPVREQEKVVGHAVRGTYLYSGIADVALATGDDQLIKTLKRLWSNMVSKRMYITGGIGSSHENEGFTRDYDLPNRSAFSETCAAIGNSMWNFRMLRLTGDSKYADTLERALYNAFLAGVSLEGDKFFYLNPLAVRSREHPLKELNRRRFSITRQSWFSTPCCPTNVIRLLASIEKYIYLKGEAQLYVNLYIGSKLEAKVGNTKVILTQSTNYPWSGRVDIHLKLASSKQFELKLRKPEWNDNLTLLINGEETEYQEDQGYIVLDRIWSSKTDITLEFDTPVEMIAANPRVENNVGRVAFQRGPLVYCLEEIDNTELLDSLTVKGKQFSVENKPNLLNGIVVVQGSAEVAKDGIWSDQLYRKTDTLKHQPQAFFAIPYHLWGHRGEGNMLVWINSSL